MWPVLPRAREQVRTAVIIILNIFGCGLQGGLVVMAVGVGVSAMQRMVEALAEMCKRACFVRLQVDSRDEGYRWLMHWLALQLVPAHSRNVSLVTSLRQREVCIGAEEESDSEVR